MKIPLIKEKWLFSEAAKSAVWTNICPNFKGFLKSKGLVLGFRIYDILVSAKISHFLNYQCKSDERYQAKCFNILLTLLNISYLPWQ